MSTKAIENVLRRAANGEETRQDEDEAATKELEAIRRACKDYTDGTEYGEPVTSGASDAVELFRSIGQKESK